VTIGIASEYAHPVEMVLGNNVPFILGPLILGNRIHLLTILVWMYFRVIGTIYDHSGYHFQFVFWTINMINIIPLGVTSRFHDFHHSDVEVNYGSNFCFWDAVFGTDISFRKHYDKLEDAKKE